MIFTTINNSVDETRKTLALFNKDWETYKRNWQNANGVFGKIGSIFTPANAITKSDVEAIKAYNAQIDACVTSQTAYNRTMLDASPAAQNLVASYNGGKVSAQGMATAQDAAKASTIGLTIAQTALNAAIGLGISVLISLVAKGINKLIHANEEAIESAKKLREEYENFKSTNTSNISALKDLEEEFNELSKGVSQYGDNISLTTDQYERYKEIIQQIVGISPSLAEGYSTENGYIADKNGLLERAIELQEIEYRNELRKITNLENLKTSMSGYIAEYKEAFNGFATDDMSAIVTKEATDFSNALYQAFNANGRDNYDSENFARDILKSLGIEDIDKEMAKFFNENGFYQSNWFFKEYADEIAKNINAITDSLSFENVGLDENEFENRILTVKDCAQAYLDVTDSISMANEAIQTDLMYIAEYADGYDNLSTEQQKFVSEYLNGFNIIDIASRDYFGNLAYDEDKMKSVKRQINDFVESLSQDETTRDALADLYAIPTDEQSIQEFVSQFRTALGTIQEYCDEYGIEIPLTISDREQTINDLEDQYQRAVDYVKDKFNGYDPTDFFKDNSINTQEEIDKWLEIAQAANDAADAELRYIQGSTLNDKTPDLFSALTKSEESLDKFQASVKSASDAYTTLLSGNYSSSELLDSIQTINQAVSEMGGTLDWEFIEKWESFDPQSQMNSLELLGGALENISRKYAESILSGAGIDIDSEFGQMLTNIIQQMYEAEAEFDAMNTQLDNLQSSYQTLTGILESYNETGYISLDNLQSLLTADENLIQMLEVENGQLILNQEAYENLVAVQLLEFKTKLNDAAAAEIEALAKQKAEEATNNNAQASEDAVAKLDAETAAFNRNTSAAIANAVAKAEESGVSETEIQGIFDKYTAVWESALNNYNGNFDSFMGGGKKAAGSAGKEAADEYVKQFEEELSHLQDLRDRGVIDEAEYLNRLRELYTRYFADRKEYLDEFNKYERQYLEGMKSLYESALSGINTLLNKRISAANESKSAAISAIEEEKSAVLDAIKEEQKARVKAVEDQKKLLEEQIKEIDKQIKSKQKVIDSINDEIQAMKDANAERQRQIDLQKAQYELERMQNQRTILQYSEEKGMHYVTDTSGIRDAKQEVEDAKLEIEIANKEKQIDLIEKEIDLLNERKDTINDQIDLLDEQIDKINEYYEELISNTEKMYDKMIKDTEKYWDSIIKGLENTKSKWEELAEVEQIAKAWSAIEQVFGELGYTVEDVLNGSGEAFEDFKSKYISLLSDMNSNASFADGLSYASGVAKEELGSFLGKTKETAEGLDVLGSKGNELDSVASSMDSLSGSASTVSKTVSDTATNLDTAATNAGTLRDNLSDVNTTISEEHTAFDNLKQTIDEVIQAINDKITAIKEEQNAVGIATSSEMADFLLLRDKILEVKESIDEVNTTVTDLDAKNLDNITNSFQLLYDKIILVSGALGSGIEGSGEGVTNSISSAIQALNDISLEEGIIAQFNNLKTAIDSVTSAISGGGGESSGSEGQGGQSGSGGSGGSGSKSGGQGSESGSSLSSAITQIGETANEVIGEPEAEGDGTVIGEFGSLKTAVNEVSEAIGIGGEEDSDGGIGQGEDDGTLIGSITNLGVTTEETLGESGGDGVIGRFEEFKDVIGEANEHVHSISDGLAAIDGQEVECTIKVNIETTGGLPAFAEGTLGNMNLESAEYNAKYGKAYATGYQGLPKDEKNALVSEYGQPEMTVFPNGETIITDSPTMMDLPKGTVIFNEDQTKKIMNGKPNVGTAHAQGTSDNGIIITPDGRTLRPLQPGDSMWDLQQKMNDYLAKTGEDVHSFLTPINTIQKDMEQMANAVNTINNINNSNRMQSINVGDIHITCPGVTSTEVAKQIGVEVNNLFNGLHLDAYQQAKMR